MAQHQENGARGRPRGPAPSVDNPKRGPAGSNTIKDPEDWVSGDDPMTGAQSSYLKTLSEEAGEPEAFDEDLSKAKASERIDELKGELGLENSSGGRNGRKQA